MHRSSPVRLAALVLLATVAVAPTACIEKRPRRDRREPAAAAPVAAPIVDATAVDGAFDALVEGERFVVPIHADDPAEGAELPLVTIVEFSDFECPFCGKLAANMAQMVLRYPEDVRLVFKQFPLPMHQHAEPAARAAVAAHAQGQFWPMHDALFADRTKLGDADITAHARALGLDMTKFAADFASPATAAKVSAETNEGRVIEVQSTPTFFVNGRKITGAKDVEALAAIVEEERAAAKKLLDAGAARSELYARFMHAAKPGAGQAKAVDPTHKRGEASKSTNYAIGPGSGRTPTGPADALVTIVAYADYGCKECAAAFATLATAREAHPEVRFAMRFLPQTPASEAASKAALAADLQGKLWDLHPRLVALGEAVDAAAARKAAEATGLDMARYDADIASPTVAAMLAEDKGVVDTMRGTAMPPLLLVNGRILENTAKPADVDALVAEESKKADAFIKTEQISQAEGFDAMLRTWRGFKQVDAVPKAVPTAAPASAKGVVGNTPVLGDAKAAKLTIVACTDLDCPACARGAKTLGELLPGYGTDVALQFRHLVPPGRTDGDVAHFAAIAAGKQGKFWEMHDALVRSRAARSNAALEKIAAGLGLDVAKWNADRKSTDLTARLQEDTAACGSLGMTGLPSWKIGDEIIQGAQPKTRFAAAIDKALGKTPAAK